MSRLSVSVVGNSRQCVSISVSVSPFIIYLCVVDLVAGVVLVVRVIPNYTSLNCR